MILLMRDFISICVFICMRKYLYLYKKVIRVKKWQLYIWDKNIVQGLYFMVILLFDLKKRGLIRYYFAIFFLNR